MLARSRNFTHATAQSQGTMDWMEQPQYREIPGDFLDVSNFNVSYDTGQPVSHSYSLSDANSLMK